MGWDDKMQKPRDADQIFIVGLKRGGFL